ncbi:MAG: hypothetical protein HOK58_09880, partial [Acidimicrobiaceae bacterium]|nr:hypothetical protein [Acidimicrobiaceae bacterium]
AAALTADAAASEGEEGEEKGDDIEIYEVEVGPGAMANGKKISELGLAHDTLIAAIVRNGKPQIGRGYSELQAFDHVVFVAHGKDVDQLSRLFTGS